MNILKHYALTSANHMHLVKSSLYLLNREKEFQRLARWAEWKQQRTRANKFNHIRDSYLNQMYRVGDKQLILRRRYPHHFRIARWLHIMSELLSPQPQVYAGSASANYRREGR